MSTIIVILIITGALLIAVPTTSADLPDTIDNGPYIDNIGYKVIPFSDWRRLALLAGEIEMDSTYIDPWFEDPSHIAALTADPDIDIAESLKYGYTYVSFNCDIYPVNITGFRRAFAFALDKNKIASDAMNGYAQVHDSVVPYQNRFCIEDDLEYDYYDARPDLGNAILDDLGFAINTTTGFRETPTGDPVNILIVYGSQKFDDVVGICKEAFASLNISVASTLPCMCELNEEMNVGLQNFYGIDLEWLALQYWSERPEHYDNMAYLPDTGFSNSSFDSLMDQLLQSSSYEETYEAASEMQNILHYNVPLIPIYQDIFLNPYRNDQFTGHIMDSAYSIYGPWTMLNIRHIDGTHGGTVTVGIDSDPDFNYWSGGEDWFLGNIYGALYTKDPDQLPYPQLIKTIEIETHSDNPSVIEGNTRFTIEIRDDIEWTDGISVAGDDVFFTLNYSLYGQTDLSAIYTPRPKVVVVEFSTESYWHFNKLAYCFIAPKHILENYDSEELTSLNLLTIDNGNSLNCGPFVLTEYEDGEFYELTPRYPYSWPDDGYGPLVALLQPLNETQVIYPSFTLRWDLLWEELNFSKQAAEHERFDLEFIPAHCNFSYTVFIDGEFYSEGTSDTQTAYWATYIDVAIDRPSLPAGQHNVTLVLDNGYYAPQIDSAMITVILPITFAGVLALAGASIIAIAAIAIIVHLRLRRSRLQHLDS